MLQTHAYYFALLIMTQTISSSKHALHKEDPNGPIIAVGEGELNNLKRRADHPSKMTYLASLCRCHGRPRLHRWQAPDP